MSQVQSTSMPAIAKYWGRGQDYDGGESLGQCLGGVLRIFVVKKSRFGDSENDV